MPDPKVSQIAGLFVDYLEEQESEFRSQQSELRERQEWRIGDSGTGAKILNSDS
jgi:hypothetical protein